MSKAKDAAAAPPAEIIPPSSRSGGKSANKDKPSAGGEAPPKDPEWDGFLSEVEADVRDEELRKLWKRYGKYVIALILGSILAVAGFEVSREYKANQRLALAKQYGQAVNDLQNGKVDDAQKAFTEISSRAGEGFADIAQLQRAAIALQKSDVDGVVAIYKALAANANTDPTLRDLATLLQVLHSFDKAPAKDLEVLLTPLLNPGNPFNGLALELSALLAAKQGDLPQAAKLVDQILSEPTTPPSLRARAQDLSAYYKTLLPPAAAAAAPVKP